MGLFIRNCNRFTGFYMLKKPSKICSACGTSAVNHRLLFILNLAEDTVGKLGDMIFQFASKKGLSQDLAFFVETKIYSFFSFFRVIKYSQDLSKALTGRSKLIWEEARRRYIPMEQFIIFGKPIELYRAKIKSTHPKWNNRMFYFHSLPIPPWLPHDGYEWMDNKYTLFEKLSKAGIPVPKAIRVVSLSGAKKAFQSLHKPIILKPKLGSRGRHTTTNINTESELVQAFKLAKEITPSMVIQEHLMGSVYRGTVIDGALVGFFRADPSQITGDGTSTIKELISQKNKTRHEKLSEIQVTQDLIDFIKRKEYTLESIPDVGVTLDLSAKTGRMYGGYTKEMLNEVHPKIRSTLEKASLVVQVPVIGFDLIIMDPTTDPDTQKWGIIEANSLPFIDLHYFALEGKITNLAINVWDLWSTPRPK